MNIRFLLLSASLAALILIPDSSFAQAFTFTSGNLTYNENFDSMGTGSPPSYVTGWTAVRAAGTGTALQTLTPATTDGSTNAGNVYSAGTAAATDRAFGTLASGTTIPSFGASFLNNTGGRITNI